MQQQGGPPCQNMYATFLLEEDAEKTVVELNYLRFNELLVNKQLSQNE